MEKDELKKKLQATGEHIFIVEDESENEKGSFVRPPTAYTKPNTGEIISAGSKITDKNVKAGRTAIFNVQAGQVISIFDTDIRVINYAQLLGVQT